MGLKIYERNRLNTAIAIIAGPMVCIRRSPLFFTAIVSIIIALTVLTQVGGMILWFSWTFLERLYKRAPGYKIPLCLAGYAFIYSTIVLFIVPHVAPFFGRVALPVLSSSEIPIKPVNIIYPLMARNYVRPELRDLLVEAARKINKKYPGGILVYYDANFPFIRGFPLLPHLSHRDGKKVDLGFFYQDKSTREPLDSPPSPIGYWVYEQPRNHEYQPCRMKKSLLRWDLDFIQPFFDHAVMDPEKTADLLKLLAQSNRVQKIFIEPHLKTRLGLKYQKIRFQGCRAARHDDHIHIQVK